ncbi:Catenin beta, partial [Fasciolopsis buskii]
GVKLLCQLLNLNSQRQEISEPICSALRHVTHRSPHAQSAIYEIRQENTFPTIASILANSEGLSAFPLIKSVVGLVRNLATDEESRAQLRSCGVTRLLARALKQTYEIIREHMNPLDGQDETEIDPTSMDLTDCIEGVRLDELLELCLAALQVMAKDAAAQTELVHTAGFLTIVVQVSPMNLLQGEHLRQLVSISKITTLHLHLSNCPTSNCFPMVSFWHQLLYSQSQSLQRAAAAFLSQLSTSASGASAIEQEGACPRLTELIQSNNEYIAAYSAAVLHRITRDKPEQYRRRLSLELRQALFDGGLVIDAPLANDESSRVSGSVVHSRQHSHNSFTAAQRSHSDSPMDKSWVDLSGSRSRSRRSEFPVSQLTIRPQFSCIDPIAGCD